MTLPAVGAPLSRAISRCRSRTPALSRADSPDLALHPVGQVLAEGVAVPLDYPRRAAVAPGQVRLQRLGERGRARPPRPPRLAGVLAPPHAGERVGRHPAGIDLANVRPVADPDLRLLVALNQRL